MAKSPKTVSSVLNSKIIFPHRTIIILGPKQPRLSGQLVSPCSMGMASPSLTTSSPSCST